MIFITSSALTGNLPDSIEFNRLYDTARYYNNTGGKHLVNGEFQAARKKLTKAKNIKEKILSVHDARLASTYGNLGVLHSHFWDNDSAIFYLEKAIKIYQADTAKDNSVNLSGVYLNLGTIYSEIGDYQKTLRIYDQAVRLISAENIGTNEKKALKAKKTLAVIYNDMGICYTKMDQYEKALEYYYKSLEIHENVMHERSHFPLGGIAYVYFKLNNARMAEKYYLKTLDNLNTYYSGKNKFLALNYHRFCDFLLNQERYEEYLLYARAAMKIYQMNFGDTHRETAKSRYYIGQYHEKMMKPDSALSYYYSALENLIPQYIYSDSSKYPSYKNTWEKSLVIDILKNTASAYELKSFSQNKITYLKDAFQLYLVCIQYLESLRLDYTGKESKYHILEKENKTYLKTLETAYKLYKETGNINYLNQAFMLSEKNKSAILLASMRNNEAMKFSGIPEDFLIHEKNLRKQIASYKEMLFEENQEKNKDNAKLLDWNNRLFQLNQSYDSIVKHYEKNYTNYYNLKYNTAVISVDQLQKKLRSDENLIEYAIFNDKMYIFLISKNIFHVKLIPLDDEFFSTLEYVRHQFIDFHDKQVTGTKKDLHMSTASLYNYIIEPVENEIRGKKLIIVPDGNLSYLPFEILVSGHENDLPGYLVYDHPISYSYSATLLYEKKEKRFHVNKKQLIAFAPTYPNRKDYAAPQNKYRDQLYPIPGAIEEVKAIKKIMTGDVFLHDQATELSFKKYAGNYKIIHLSMHTLINNEDPMYSKLAFYNDPHSDEDGLLNTYEIYNLQLNTDLAVLSSCSTGKGHMKKGEGIVCLARAFSYAQCRSAVMTLWEVEDKSTVELIKTFYKQLIKGKDKDTALQQAKIEYLRNADNNFSHPFYWSTFMLIGDNTNIFPFFNEWYMVILFFIFLSVDILVRRNN